MLPRPQRLSPCWEQDHQQRSHIRSAATARADTATAGTIRWHNVRPRSPVPPVRASQTLRCRLRSRAVHCGHARAVPEAKTTPAGLPGARRRFTLDIRARASVVPSYITLWVKLNFPLTHSVDARRHGEFASICALYLMNAHCRPRRVNFGCNLNCVILLK